MVGYYFTDIGPLNQIVHMWGYEILDDRFERRTTFQASEIWQAYAKKDAAACGQSGKQTAGTGPVFQGSLMIDRHCIGEGALRRQL